MPKSYKKKRYKGKRKTKFTRRKISRGVPAAVMASETKIQKNIIDIDNVDNLLDGAHNWYTPYNGFDSTANIHSVFSPQIYTTAHRS